MPRIFQRQNLANLITFSRLGFLPLIVLTGLLEQPAVFVAVFAAQAFLDAIDGLVARRLHSESDLGRRLDTVIDLAIWLPSLAIAVWLLRDTFTRAFADYPHLFLVPVLTSALMYLTAYYYLRAVAAIHLYSGKLTSALVLILLLTTLLDRFYPLLGYLTAGAAVIYHLEAITIYALRKDQTDENVVSLPQVLGRTE